MHPSGEVDSPSCQTFWKIPVPTPDASKNYAKCDLSPQSHHCATLTTGMAA